MADTERYVPSDIPDILTRLYKNLKKNNFLLAETSNLDKNLKADLIAIKQAWKQCWQETTDILNTRYPTASGGAAFKTDIPQQRPQAPTPAQAQLGALPQMLLSSFNEIDQKKLMKELEKGTKKVDDIEREKEELRTENERLKRRIDELTELLSQYMGAKMATDERHIENINDPCRPMALCDEYRIYCSKQWLDAKTELDKINYVRLDEQTKCEFLSRVVEFASVSALSYVNEMFEVIDRTSESPAVQVPPSEIAKAKRMWFENKRIPDEVKLAVIKFLRLRAENIEIPQWRKMVVTHVLQEMKVKKRQAEYLLENAVSLKKYVVDGCSLAWKMALQLPPMRFSCEDTGSPFNQDRHELVVGSVAPSPKAVVDYYVNPTMLHYDDVVVKGRVILRRK